MPVTEPDSGRRPLFSGVCIAYAVLTAGLLVALAGTLSVHQGLSYLAGAFLVFVSIPWVLAASIGLVVSVLLALLGPFAMVPMLLGQPTGFASLAEDAIAIPARVVPGYYRALRGVQSPAVWGVVVGAFVAMLILAGCSALRGAS